jgi:hypothetical protein
MADIGCATSVGFEPEEKLQADLPVIRLGAPEDGLER